MTYEQKAAQDLVDWFATNCAAVANPSGARRWEVPPPSPLTAPMPPQTGPLARLLEGPFCGK
jgi:hypothetical protein